MDAKYVNDPCLIPQGSTFIEHEKIIIEDRDFDGILFEREENRYYYELLGGKCSKCGK